MSPSATLSGQVVNEVRRSGSSTTWLWVDNGDYTVTQIKSVMDRRTNKIAVQPMYGTCVASCGKEKNSQTLAERKQQR